MTLEILKVIEERSDVTQRDLARRTGMALGLANSYLRRCVRKGLVKIHDAPANRYLYYLTPKGFSEKTRLTAQFFAHSFSFYRRASESCAEAYRRCHGQGWHRVVLCGASELAEIAAVRAMEQGVEVAGVYDAHSKAERVLAHRVVERLDDVEGADAWMVTDLSDPQGCYEALCAELPRERVLVPAVLGVRVAATG